MSTKTGLDRFTPADLVRLEVYKQRRTAEEESAGFDPRMIAAGWKGWEMALRSGTRPRAEYMRTVEDYLKDQVTQ